MPHTAHRFPLQGIYILDLTRLLPGAYCTLLLADLGAEVLKIEDTEGGDYGRWTPPLVKETSTLFLSLNRNKKSMKLNLKTGKGREIFRKLLKKGDVLVEGFRPGVMRRLGLSYGALRKINPRLIYCSITGYGQDGPYKDKAGHDINYMGISGALGASGPAGGPPGLPAFQLADIGGGSYAPAVAILAALFNRTKTKKGLYLDASMMEGALSFMTIHFGKMLAPGNRFERGMEPLSGGVVCYNIYQTKDGKYMSLGALEPKFWKNLCLLLGRNDLIGEQFSPPIPENPVMGQLQEIFKGKTRDEWVEVLKGKDVCCEPIYDLNEVPSDPHIVSRRCFFEMNHPSEGKIPQVRTPIRFPGFEKMSGKPPPQYGEHTEEVLRGLGYSKKAIKQFKAKGVI